MRACTDCDQPLAMSKADRSGTRHVSCPKPEVPYVRPRVRHLYDTCVCGHAWKEHIGKPCLCGCEEFIEC